MIRKRFSGKFDGILVLVTLLAISSFVASSLFVIMMREGIQFPIWLLPAGVAIFASILLAIFGGTKLWLLMGNTSLSKRLCLVALIDFIPCAYLLIGFSYAELRLGFAKPTFGQGTGTDLLLGVFTQRLLVWMVFVAMGWAMQFYSRWRITGPIGEPTMRRKLQTSLGDIMVLTTFVASVCACLTYWMQVAQTPRSRNVPALEEVVGAICAVSFVEVGLVLLFLMLPLCVSHGAPWLRKHFAGGVALWTCFLGAIVAVFGFLVGIVESWSAAFTYSLGFVVGHAVFAVGLFAMLYMVIRAGFRCETQSATQKPGEESSSSVSAASTVPARRVSWTAASICALGIVATAGFYTLYDIPILLATRSFSNAKLAAMMNRREWMFPQHKYINKPRWNGQRIAFLSKSNTFYFRGNDQKLTRLVQDFVSKVPKAAMTLQFEEPASKMLLDELGSRSFSELILNAGEIPKDDFDAFCKVADVQSISLSSTTPGLIESLSQIKTLKTVSLGSTYDWHARNAKAIQALPLKKLRIRLFDGKLDTVAALKRINELTVVSSLITEETVDQLSQLKLKALRFQYCRIDAAAARKFSNLSTTGIQWDDAGRRDVSDEAIFALVESSTAEWFHIVTEREPEFEAKLANRNKLSSMTIDCTGDPDDLVEITIVEGEELLKRLATTIVRNEVGDVTEIDLQAVSLRRAEFDELEKLKHLSRLRVGTLEQTRIWFQRIGELRSLRELEIAAHPLDSSAFEMICKLEKLKRLQLPICVDVDEFRHPEVVPIPRQKVEKLDLAEVAIRLEILEASAFDETSEDGIDPYVGATGEDGYGLGYGSYGYERYNGRFVDDFPHLVSPEAFKAISKLKDLEYLFMPGYLLTEDSLKEIEKLEQLKELHAVLSVVDRSLLERIVQLKNLKALSIGTRGVDAKFVEVLSQLDNLQTLQIVLFNERVNSSKKRQQAILRNVQKALPNCKVHLIFVGEPF